MSMTATETHRRPETTSDFASMEPGDLVAFLAGTPVLRVEQLHRVHDEDPVWVPLAHKPVRRGYTWLLQFERRRSLEASLLELAVRRKHG